MFVLAEIDLTEYSLPIIVAVAFTAIVIIYVIALRMTRLPLCYDSSALVLYFQCHEWLPVQNPDYEYSWKVGEAIVVDYNPPQFSADNHTMVITMTEGGDEMMMSFTARGEPVVDHPALVKDPAIWKVVGTMILARCSQ